MESRRRICVIFVRVLIKKGYNKRFVYICYQNFRRARSVAIVSAIYELRLMNPGDRWNHQ